MASDYDLLTPAEQDTWNEYTRLRQVSDWQGFSAAQDARRAAARAWIVERREYISDLANGDVAGEPAGWDHANRQERFDFLGGMNGGEPRNVCQLPTTAGTPSEKALITEREAWWNITTDYAEQKARRQANVDELIDRRQYVWHLAEGQIPGETPGWDHADRRQRYANLQVATRYGSAYADWCDTHDQTTGAELGSGSSGRQAALDWMEAHRGCFESPAGSNCDSRTDGIRTAQDACVEMGSSGTWLRYEPWCGVWCANAMAAGGVKNLSYNLASVEWIEAQAKAGRAPFTGWTTDPGRVRAGDLVTLFSPGQHVGMVLEPGSNPVTEEGNSQDTSARRQRNRSDVVGYALVAFP
jgi:hypothetical protein